MHEESFLFIVDTREEEAESYFVANSIKKYTIKAGCCLSSLDEGTVGFLTKGSLKVYMADKDGNERLMWILNEKSTLYTILLDIFTKRILALNDCEILIITLDQYYNYLLQNKNHLSKYFQVDRYRYALCLQQCLASNNQSSRSKVYNLIYKLALKYGEPQKDGSIILNNIPSKCDIASITGVHRSNVTSYMSELKKNGIIHQNKSKYSIIIREIGFFEEDEFTPYRGKPL
jgi:cAMP-binding proteins - catabolite gene activator and regulatory subunit of cAMP-dependent protein kinases